MRSSYFRGYIKMKNKILTDKVINRLTLYHSILTDYIEKNIEYVSSTHIAELLHIDNTQI